jgi:hypothetical protein
MAKRMKPQRNGDKIWNAGIFVGKTDGDLWLIFQEDGLHACRSVRPIGEVYSPEKINNVRVYPWQVKHSLLGARVVPQKNQERAQAVVPLALAPRESPEAVQDGEQGDEEHHTEDEAASDPPSEEENFPQGVLPEPIADDTTPEDVVQQDSDVREPGSDTLAEGGIQHRPEFEEVGSPSKIPRRRLDMPRFSPGGTASAREVCHDDEAVDYDDCDYLSAIGSDDEEDFYEGNEEEVLPEEKSEERLPERFFTEEGGPPEVEQEVLEELDRRAKRKEILRLTKMGAIKKVTVNKEEETEELPFADTEKEEFKWLTTKFVLDWRFREGQEGSQNEQRHWQRRARLVAREYRSEGNRDDVFAPTHSNYCTPEEVVTLVT